MREIKGVTLYQCEKCNQYYWTKQSAEKCCPTRYCEDCGKELTNYLSVCEKCHEKRVYDRAEKLTYDEYIKKYPNNMLYYNEKYYPELESLLDDFYGKEIPKFCYGTDIQKVVIDIDSAIEFAEEDMEDSFFDEDGLKELRKYIKDWNEKYGYNAFWQNEKIIVLIPEIKTYKEWVKHFKENGTEIIDPDGFRNISNFNEDMEFTKEEFEQRLSYCTIIGRNNK